MKIYLLYECLRPILYTNQQESNFWSSIFNSNIQLQKQWIDKVVKIWCELFTLSTKQEKYLDRKLNELLGHKKEENDPYGREYLNYYFNTSNPIKDKRIQIDIEDWWKAIQLFLYVDCRTNTYWKELYLDNKSKTLYICSIIDIWTKYLKLNDYEKKQLIENLVELIY